ncbi:Purple acid Phosphatase, N-terminal domain [Pseudoalteromonas denitrificans DSM 6059]|uniref:Purple acid Phosphatase, N-terminal domain n=1 Tax=Pseudoalteromonas denitrificans DSM 6059 TaxID=1123010 RepID=A0A1I1P2W2_9GAMM|nr:Purple acid Phosphatase, N-terminal domain [Pseudoalteromonas denitrificans DSM 6059]
METPTSGASNTPIRPTFSWQTQNSVTSYRIEIATDSSFNNIAATGTVNNGTNYQPSADLAVNTTYYWRVRADNGCGNTWSSTATFTTSAAASSSTLIKGTAKTNLASDSGTEKAFTFDVPAGASKLTFKTSGGSGDVDLHVKFGQKATSSTYDCRPYKPGNTETCAITNVQEGTYHVMLKGYETYAGVSLIADYDTAPGSSNTIDETGLAGTASTKLYRTITVPSGMSSLNVALSGGTGDADLYVNFASKPTTSTYKCRPFQPGNTETCTINNPEAGQWHIGVFGYETFADIKLTASSK